MQCPNALHDALALDLCATIATESTTFERKNNHSNTEYIKYNEDPQLVFQGFRKGCSHKGSVVVEMSKFSLTLTPIGMAPPQPYRGASAT